MNKLFISIVLVFVVVAGALVFQASQEGTSSVILPSALAANSAVDMKRIRVGGRVAALPVDYRVEPTIELKFSLEDPGSNPATKHPGIIPVVYSGIKPDMFAPGRDVIIDGDFTGGTLTAHKLLTQCPSKYEAPSAETMYKK
ncbi:MAG: cytochrome c maturation protein CcmE [Deltaproteobacteria bacterium]|nr:cytochrome c maturation protein CcmE [Deltaproteobacteria bacterium]